MIFVTVGTHHEPFDRLMQALSLLGDEELVVQHGPASPPPGVHRAEAYMPFDQMLEYFAAAEKVILHAGVGSILCATRAGHTPLIVPRRHDLGEHVDDHQAELTRALGADGKVIPVWDTADLPRLLAAAPRRDAHPRAAEEKPLASAIRAALLDRPRVVQPSDA